MAGVLFKVYEIKDGRLQLSISPISNLPFLSKILERAVADQVQKHMTNHNLYEPFGSGFRKKKNSTETALIKIINDLLIAADSDYISSLLILLDRSATLDTVSQSLACLVQYSLGFSLI